MSVSVPLRDFYVTCKHDKATESDVIQASMPAKFGFTPGPDGSMLEIWQMPNMSGNLPPIPVYSL